MQQVLTKTTLFTKGPHGRYDVSPKRIYEWGLNYTDSASGYQEFSHSPVSDNAEWVEVRRVETGELVRGHDNMLLPLTEYMTAEEEHDHHVRHAVRRHDPCVKDGVSQETPYMTELTRQIERQRQARQEAAESAEINWATGELITKPPPDMPRQTDGT